MGRLRYSCILYRLYPYAYPDPHMHIEYNVVLLQTSQSTCAYSRSFLSLVFIIPMTTVNHVNKHVECIHWLPCALFEYLISSLFLALIQLNSVLHPFHILTVFWSFSICNLIQLPLDTLRWTLWVWDVHESFYLVQEFTPPLCILFRKFSLCSFTVSVPAVPIVTHAPQYLLL